MEILVEDLINHGYNISSATDKHLRYLIAIHPRLAVKLTGGLSVLNALQYSRIQHFIDVRELWVKLGMAREDIRPVQSALERFKLMESHCASIEDLAAFRSTFDFNVALLLDEILNYKGEN